MLSNQARQRNTLYQITIVGEERGKNNVRLLYKHLFSLGSNFRYSRGLLLSTKNRTRENF